MLRKMKLTGKISTVVMTLLVLGFGVFGVITYTVSSGIISNIIQTNLMNSAQDAATIFANKYKAMQTDAILVADRYDIRTMNWDIQKTALKNIVKTMGYFSAAVADLDGDAHFTNGTTANVSERDYFKNALAGKTTMTDPLMSKADNMLVVVVASPIWDNNDKIIGVLMISHEADALTAMASDITVGKTGYGYLLNQNGVVIAYPEIEKVIDQYSFIQAAESDASLRELADIQRKMVSGETGYGSYTYQGVRKVTSYMPVPGTNWSIGLTAPRNEFFSEMKTLQLIILATTFAFLIICAFAMMALIRSTVIRPILKLAGVSERIALGEVELAVDTDAQDEIGILARAFAKIIDNAKAQARSVERIAAGDLTVSVPVRSNADLLGIKLNEMISRNNEALFSITTAADQVAMGARQLSDSSVLLSQGATEQASSLEQLAVAVDEIAGKTEANAEHATEANRLAERAKTNAAEGDRHMQGMLQAMDDINTSSDGISKIIKVIDDIAFQTNILALNAAVEAARAGQHGKGFAVVAEEVRNLAAKSARAVQETTELIENSVRKVDAGTKIAKETATSLHSILGDITTAAGLVSNITEASLEQAQGIAQIKQALSQINTVVQTNTATAEESAASSEELAAQADIMKGQVSRFKLKAVAQEQSLFDRDTAAQHLPATRPGAQKVRISLDDVGFGKY